MFRSILASIALGLVAVGAMAQDADTTTKPLDLDAAIRRPFQFLARPPQALKWRPDSQSYSYVKRDGRRFELMSVDAVSGKETLLLDNKTLQDSYSMPLETERPLSASQVGGGTWVDMDRIRVTRAGKVFMVNLKTQKIRVVFATPGGTEAQAYSKDDQYAAYVKDHNIHVLKPDGSDVKISADGHEFITYGVAVSRVEFGITDGLWWGPKNRRLAFYREDLRPIEVYPYIDWTKTPAVYKLGRYPMAGRPMSVVTIGVYDSRNDKVIYLDTDPEADEYLTNVTWGPGGEHLYVAHVNREQNQTDLWVYDAKTGKAIKKLFSENDEEWTEPEHGPIFIPGTTDFLWFSPRDGFNHLYRYSVDGELKAQVSKGPWDIEAFSRFSKDHKSFYFVSTGPVPIEKHLFKLNLDGTGLQAMTQGRGQHTAMLAPNESRVLDSHTNMNLPRRVDLCDANATIEREVFNAKNPFEGWQKGQDSLFKTKTKDGADLHGHIILPPNVDKSRKYPVLLYVYGGPHSQLTRDEWMGGMSSSNVWQHYMACQGFIVLRLDGRGTKNRGIEWVQAIHRDMGTLEIEDQLAGLKYVENLGFADMKRVGVTGWSYGGFMTLSLMTRAGDHFAAGVSGAPVTDWKFYETGYGERYMDTPAENPEGYKRSAPATHLDGLKGRLLVVQGSSDETVVWQHTVDFLNSCIKKGKEVEYMAYPMQVHGLRGAHRQHFMKKMTKFFIETLKP